MKRRVLYRVEGAVQGVGFRPFVYRIARELALAGEVRNTPRGAEIEVEGTAEAVGDFGRRLTQEKPEACIVMHMETHELEARNDGREFVIGESEQGAAKSAVLLPDLATCGECLDEIRAAEGRRSGYAFTNCTNCGPRFTIIEDIPYDRVNTTMRGFAMCAACRSEYENPGDRRFHAQPIACPECGPKLSATLAEAAAELRAGRVVALKGIGGYQLLVDARNSAAVQRLRVRKHREEKPFAVMFPDVAAVEAACWLSEEERKLLESAAAPIVLLTPRAGNGIATEVSMSSAYLGAMRPYSPLHVLLMEEVKFPLVATSGNRSDEPIAIENSEARERLSGIADFFLEHDRPVARACDDSVARVVNGGVALIRRARGYAPLPVEVARPLKRVLAVGAHQKNTVAIAIERRVFLSQHLGDLDTAESCAAFERAIVDLARLYEFEPELVACDLHPDYWSTQYAERLGLPLVGVQHHEAHVAAAAAEHGVVEPYLGVAWDGTGYGRDGVIWGSEFFRVENGEYERVGHLRPFRLPGGEGAVKDCRRTAFSILTAAGMETEWLEVEPAKVVAAMLERGVNSPWTTSMGRLFDAAAVVAGVARRNGFEGQAPMKLEAAIEGPGEDWYECEVGAAEFDWGPVVQAMRRDPGTAGDKARRFHNTMGEWILGMARRVGCERVVLSGGVFQNGYLAARVERRLAKEGFGVHLARRVPANDGGIALGQAVIAG
ncbi:MAG: carbamoyltransferase HypF [Bryobacteraceae bacterium]|nr:carbamoyltransferase HypF [Bryobacteraceae bacterium]